MKNFKLIMAFAALSMIFLSSCSKDDPVNDPNNPSAQKFGIKTATIVYDFMGFTTTLYFDNNGAQVCIETNYNSTYVPTERVIWDGKKGYSFNLTDKTYQEITQAKVQDDLDMYYFTETDYSGSSIFTKTTDKIAGKDCSVYTGTVPGSLFGGTSDDDLTVSYGGWSGIYFLMIVNGDDWLRAESFSETVPADIFKVPAGYTKQ